MAKEIDWDTVEEENASAYKDYAPEGTYKTKVEKVELQEASTGNKGIRFILADNNEYAFPKYGAVGWLSAKNPSWRMHHMKELFVVLGFTEAQARKAVEQCEDNEDKLAEAYLAMFEKALPKSKEVEVAVFYQHESDDYCTWDFKSDAVRMTRPEKDKKKETKVEDILDNAEPVNDDDVPF